MRILLLTQFFQPEQFFKGLPFARELVRRGNQVQVLTGFPHYPGGKIYDGYRIQAWQRESIEGIPVIRVPVYPSHDRSSIRRIMTYSSFTISAAILGPILTRPADVLYVFPPIPAGLAAIMFKRLRGTPFVVDIQDLWPDSLEATGMMLSRSMLNTVSGVCRIVYRNAARIVVLSQGFARELANRGAPLERITVIHNWGVEGDLCRRVQEPHLAARLGMDQHFNVVFAGTFGLSQHLDTVLDAARLLQDLFPRIQFVLVGTGVEEPKLRRRAETERLANVRFLGWRTASEASQIMALSDALLAHLKDDPLFEITIPSKTQVYLAAGRPIIMAVRGEAAYMVTEANAGLTAEPDDPRSLADAVVALYRLSQPEREAMGRNGRAYYAKHLSLSAGVDKFERVFAAVVEETSHH